MDSGKTSKGRPRKAVKRKATTGVRYTEQEYEIVKRKAASACLRLTVYIREISLTGHVIARLSTEEKQQLRALAGIANNLNQMAKKAHQDGLVKAAVSFDKYLSELEEILRRVKG